MTMTSSPAEPLSPRRRNSTGPGPAPASPVVVDVEDSTNDTSRGGYVRVLPSLHSSKQGSGFMGCITVEPNQSISEHFHPHSEESLLIVKGVLTVWVKGQPHEVREGQAILIPPFSGHRLENRTDSPAHAVFAVHTTHCLECTERRVSSAIRR